MTALREYAPGANVVIDGLVYQSAGITLNWHAPATAQDVAEIQNIRRAWRCGHCGASGTTVQALQLQHCPECGFALQAGANRNLSYLEPAGFAVDIYESAHNDVSVQTYVPVENPWINGDGDWLPLSNSVLGRFRSTTQGSVFHYSSGAHGMGYMLCLECGRAGPEGDSGDEDSRPFVFRRPHKRLRGAQGGQDRECAGSNNEFAIKRGLRFGREYTTDVLELVLVGLNGRPLSDASATYSIAVALRQAIAASLGVEETELGCDTKPIRTDSGEVARAIQVFDMRSAGYASLVGPNLNSLLVQTREHLQCGKDCDDACQHCLMTFDTRFRTESLDRHKALQFLTDEWLAALRLPDEHAYFGEGSAAEYQPLAEALTREFSRPDTDRLFVYLTGQSSEWDLAASPLRSLLHRLSTNTGKEIAVVMEPGARGSAAPENLAVLRGLNDACGVSLWEGRCPTSRAGSVVFASVISRSGACLSFASAQGPWTTVGPAWGSLGEAPLVRNQTMPPKLIKNLSLSDHEVKLQGLEGAVRIEISTDLDGPAMGFGERLLGMILKRMSIEVLSGASAATLLRYEDRYLKTPVAAGLLVEFVSALKQHLDAQDRWRVEQLVVVTCAAEADSGRGFGAPIHVTQDWRTTAARDLALKQAFGYCGLDAKVEVLDRRNTLHSRIFSLLFADGRELKIWLDQGFSYWSAARGVLAYPTVFPFSSAGNEQGHAIAEPRFKAIGHARPTYLFVSMS